MHFVTTFSRTRVNLETPVDFHGHRAEHANTKSDGVTIIKVVVGNETSVAVVHEWVIKASTTIIKHCPLHVHVGRYREQKFCGPEERFLCTNRIACKFRPDLSEQE